MKKIITLVFIVGAVLAGYLVYQSGSQKTVDLTVIPSPSVSANLSVSATPVFSANPTSSPTVSPKIKNSYTLAEVAQHSNAMSCYSAINGSVYDLTAWINQHPGGANQILSICGKDGSSAFNTQHGGKQKQADILAGFKIGALAN